MKKSSIKIGITIILLNSATLLSTCNFHRTPIQTDTITQDTIFLSQWRREKNEKLFLIASYEKKLSSLQHDIDSLKTLVVSSKTLTSVYRFKAKHFENQLKQVIVGITAKDSLATDSLSPILDSLIESRQRSDEACDTTIHALETIVANLDSSLCFHRDIEDNLKEINKEQEYQNQALGQQLGQAIKENHRKTRQNRILTGGILILTGITTTLFLINSLR